MERERFLQPPPEWSVCGICLEVSSSPRPIATELMSRVQVLLDPMRVCTFDHHFCRKVCVRGCREEGRADRLRSAR
mgnify:CR=1 FL=1